MDVIANQKICILDQFVERKIVLLQNPVLYVQSVLHHRNEAVS